MAIALKILNTILILFAVFMGIKQGGAMLTGKPAMTDMFAKWNIGKTGVNNAFHLLIFCHWMLQVDNYER